MPNEDLSPSFLRGSDLGMDKRRALLALRGRRMGSDRCLGLRREEGRPESDPKGRLEVYPTLDTLVSRNLWGG